MTPIKRLENTVRDVAQADVMPFFLQAAYARKADGSVLSEADLAAQAALMTRLPEIMNAPVLSEEMTFEMQQALWKSAAQTGLWVLDPIDGTNNFVNGIPHFALSVAFIREGRTQLGVVLNPVSGECFSAVKGQGAWLNGVRLPLRQVSKRLREAVAGVEVKRLRSAKLVSNINNLPPFGTLRSMGSSTLDWCYLAAGRYDIYLHGGQHLWDYAAGALIAQEAGARLETLEGDEFWSGQHVFKRSVIAAVQPDLFEKWLAWVRKCQ